VARLARHTSIGLLFSAFLLCLPSFLFAFYYAHIYLMQVWLSRGLPRTPRTARTARTARTTRTSRYDPPSTPMSMSIDHPVCHVCVCLVACLFVCLFYCLPLFCRCCRLELLSVWMGNIQPYSEELWCDSEKCWKRNLTIVIGSKDKLNNLQILKSVGYSTLFFKKWLVKELHILKSMGYNKTFVYTCIV